MMKTNTISSIFKRISVWSIKIRIRKRECYLYCIIVNNIEATKSVRKWYYEKDEKKKENIDKINITQAIIKKKVKIYFEKNKAKLPKYA